MTENWQKITFIIILILIAGWFLYRYISPRGKCERQARRLTAETNKTKEKYDSNPIIAEMFKTVIDTEIEKCLKNSTR